jgi:hypothetical protein
MVYWILQAHLKEVDLSQTRETMTLQNLRTLHSIELFCVEGPHDSDGNEIAFG